MDKQSRRQRRSRRTRARIAERDIHRLCVHRTPRHIYAQIIAPDRATVVTTASTVQKDVRKGPITEAGVFFAWLTDGMEPQVESSLKSYVPAPVILLLGKVFGRRYNRQIAPAWKV